MQRDRLLVRANFEYEVVIPSICILFGVGLPAAASSFPAIANMPANVTNVPMRLILAGIYYAEDHKCFSFGNASMVTFVV